MEIFLDRVDSVPLQDDSFSFSFNSWISVMVDTINENLSDLESTLNGQGAWTRPLNLTQAQILALEAQGVLPDSVLLYCTDHVPPCYVGRISGSLVQFNTSPFP